MAVAIFDADQAKFTKNFPTSRRNPVSHKTYLSFNFCRLQYNKKS